MGKSKKEIKMNQKWANKIGPSKARAPQQQIMIVDDWTTKDSGWVQMDKEEALQKMFEMEKAVYQTNTHRLEQAIESLREENRFLKSHNEELMEVNRGLREKIAKMEEMVRGLEEALKIVGSAVKV